MSTPLDTLLAQCGDAKSPAVIAVESLTADEANRLVSALAAKNIQARVLDGSHLSGKADLLRDLAAAFAFPSYFGHNWDALIDCWSDMAWLPAQGYVCVLRGADAFHAADAAAHDALLTACRDVAERWRHHDAQIVFKLVRVAAK
jgi:RNAse (barnase) inhibitor barstar